ncbi:MAG: hypothetical protein JNM68_11510 [Dinghuibacter sp.]|nr:hypothetical protein [Dinghuibacter sp.]
MNNNDLLQFKRTTEDEIRALKRKNNLLLLLVTVCMGGILVSSFTHKRITSFESIRTKEMIIEDRHGTDRIIIAPEITVSKNRQRNDTLCGVLVLDEQGQDRVILGASPTVKINGNIIKRATNGPYGIAFNDEQGTEKGGLGYYADKGLAALGLDGPGGEGIVLFVPQKELFGQKAGILINDPKNGGQLIYIGANLQGERMINMDVAGKGRFSITIDSTASAKMKYYNYTRNTEKTVLSAGTGKKQ